MSLVARVVDFTIGAMAFVDDDELEVLIFLHRRADAALVEEAKARLMEAVGRARGGAAFRQVRARLFTPAGQAPYGSEETSLQGFIALPVVTGERLSGLLAMGGKAVARLHPDTEAFLKQVANQAYIVTENSRLFDRVKNLSIRDSLTGLYNHRHSMELLAQEFERVARYEGSVSLLMIDIDHFKQINDASGHQAGDQVLREVARTLREGLRTVDALGRYGGEEFVAVLPHTPSVEALATAERLRRAVAEADLSSGGKPIRATISVGVASCPAPGMDAPGDLVRAADKALYAAKQAGRNRVVGPRQA
jgi:diguanylate cyclase (GGDEF)-like protein